MGRAGCNTAHRRESAALTHPPRSCPCCSKGKVRYVLVGAMLATMQVHVSLVCKLVRGCESGWAGC